MYAYIHHIACHVCVTELFGFWTISLNDNLLKTSYVFSCRKKKKKTPLVLDYKDLHKYSMPKVVHNLRKLLSFLGFNKWKKWNQIRTYFQFLLIRYSLWKLNYHFSQKFKLIKSRSSFFFIFFFNSEWSNDFSFVHRSSIKSKNLAVPEVVGLVMHALIPEGQV